MNACIRIDELRNLAATATGPRGDRPATVTLTLSADDAALVDVTELARLLSTVPVAGVRLAEAVDFTVLPGRVVTRVLAVVRECSSIGARLDWSLTLDAARVGLIPRLDHLPAPRRVIVVGQSSPWLGEWRSSGMFGLCYFRKGPTFLSIVDQRNGPDIPFIVEDPAMVEIFHRGLSGCAWSAVATDPSSEAAAQRLVEQGLLLRAGDHCVTLPVHMRSWPVGVALLGGTLASAGKKKPGSDQSAENAAVAV